MSLRRPQVSHYLTMSFCLVSLPAVSVLSIQAAHSYQASSINTLVSHSGRRVNPSNSSVHYGQPPAPHADPVEPLSLLHSGALGSHGHPESPAFRGERRANREAKTAAAKPKEGFRRLSEAPYSEDQTTQVPVDEDSTAYAPLRAYPSAQVIANYLWPGPSISTPFGISKVDERLMSLLFHVWAALHPQDAAYYINLSQTASTPALNPITGIYDLLNSHNRFFPQSTTTQLFPFVNLSGAVLQELLVELLSRSS